MFIGKLIGVLFGLGWGYLGALLGLILGHFFDRSVMAVLGRSGAGFGQAWNPEAGQNTSAQTVFFKSCFSAMGCLAKADGRVSEEEIAKAEQIMSTLGLSADARREAIEHFKRGTQAEFSLDEVLEEFRRHCGTQTNLSQLLIEFLVSVALADGELHEKEADLLKQVAQYLGFSAPNFDRLMEMLKAQQHFRSNPAGASIDQLQLAYRALGIEPEVDDRTLKKAYRKLMSEHHPDKLIAQGVPEDMIKIATEKSQEIQSAYALIKQHRDA